MSEINVKFSDGSLKKFEKNISIKDVLSSLNIENNKKFFCVAKVNGVLTDFSATLQDDCEIEFLDFENSKDAKKTYWHTTAHIMAQAVGRLFKNVKFAIGPAIDEGFYYDFDLEKPIKEEDLVKIENEMKKIIKEDLPVQKKVLPSNEALDYMQSHGQTYKVELIKDLEKKGADIVFRTQGEFTDLCGGTHLLSTGKVKAFKLLSLTGAYWRGDSKGKMLQRIYGISFPNEDELKKFLIIREEAKKRDHRKLGKELNLFMISPEGQGFPFFLPNGMIIRDKLIDFWRKEHKKAGYVEIKTPMILSKDLWVRSGHWEHYKENMYITVIDDVEHAIKPMNCPGGMLVYKNSLHSYRDLPERVSELGLVHRHELSGTLHGLMRVRCFTQDDAHIFMTKEQIESEILGVIKLIDKFYSTFGFEYFIELSTRPKDSMGTDEQWEKATEGLKAALEHSARKYKINEGDGAFYGPKIDFHLKDSIGRTWQCGTIQLDFNLPERFDLTYVGEDGLKHRPVMIHRVIFGSVERFIGILTEHFAGDFPLWLAPVQAIVLPISEEYLNYAKDVYNQLVSKDIRVKLDSSNEKIGKKIRQAELNKIPYMLIVGKKEKSNNTVNVRTRCSSREEEIEITKLCEDMLNEIFMKEIKNKNGST